MNNNLRNRHHGIYTHKSHAQSREINANSTLHKNLSDYLLHRFLQCSGWYEKQKKRIKTTGEIDKINLSELQKKGIRASPLTIFPFLVGETFLPLHSPLTGMRMGTVRWKGITEALEVNRRNSFAGFQEIVSQLTAKWVHTFDRDQPR